MIDLHCHILPGVDDGPATIEDSLDLARAHVAAGTTVVAATSHVSWDYPGNIAERLAPLTAEVRERVRAEGIPLEILTGGEIALTRIDGLPADDLGALTLGGGPWLLVECPFTPSASLFVPMIDMLLGQGRKVVLAHPERSPGFHREPERLRALVERGAVTSLTAGAFTGRFGSEVRRVAHTLLADGLVHSVASDAHDLLRRPPGIAPVLREAGLDADLIAWLGRDVPRALLDGAPLPEPPGPFPAAPGRRRARWLRRGS